MRISIFVTSYNQKRQLEEAVDSALAQSLPAHEVIIVDDHSSDGSQDLISDYARRFPDVVTAVYHPQNTGVARVRIDALNAVTGDYVTYVDGDDILLPDKLAREAGALQATPDARIAFSNSRYVSSDRAHVLEHWVEGEPVPQGDIFWHTFARAFPKRRLFRMELVDYRAWKDIGFHDPSLALYEDFDMRIRLTKRLKAVYVDEVLSEVRVNANGLSKRSLGLHLRCLDAIYRKNAPLLADLPPARRAEARARLRRFIADVGRQAVKGSLRDGNVAELARTAFFTLKYETGLI